MAAGKHEARGALIPRAVARDSPLTEYTWKERDTQKTMKYLCFSD